MAGSPSPWSPTTIESLHHLFATNRPLGRWSNRKSPLFCNQSRQHLPLLHPPPWHRQSHYLIKTGSRWLWFSVINSMIPSRKSNWQFSPHHPSIAWLILSSTTKLCSTSMTPTLLPNYVVRNLGLPLAISDLRFWQLALHPLMWLNCFIWRMGWHHKSSPNSMEWPTLQIHWRLFWRFLSSLESNRSRLIPTIGESEDKQNSLGFIPATVELPDLVESSIMVQL